MAQNNTTHTQGKNHAIAPERIERLRNRLAGAIEGEARFDRLSRAIYATDASNYQIIPAGVVIPKNRADVAATVRACAAEGIPLTPRGAGTALSGQAIGRGIVLDVSKYMNRILEINIAEKWARVEPGVVLDELNLEIVPQGLHFAPDVATSSRATIGGMIANNSAGAHSLIYGMTADHVIELEVVLSDGSVAQLREIAPDVLRSKCEKEDLEGRCYRTVARLGREHAEEIERRFPKIRRRVGGYNLDRFVPGKPFNLANIVLGSEGTLAVVTAAKIRLTALPKATALCVVHFETLREALVAVAPILGHKPSAVEFIERRIIEETEGHREYESLRDFVKGRPEALLAVEFFGEHESDLLEKIENLEKDLKERGLGYYFYRALDAEAQDRVWRLRKAGLGLLMAVRGDEKPTAFVEDTAVDAEHLPDFIDRFLKIIESHGTTAAVYAHASVGCLHVRPLLNLKTAEGVRKYASIAEQVADLVLEYGGALSSEHGDGRTRSPFIEKMFGPVLYGAFREIKQTFDPKGLFNPGLIVNPDPITAHLRYGAGYKTPEIPTMLDFSADGGIVRAAELCSGVGHCRKKTEGTMCPSYMVTLEEQHSTRARANTLRLAMTGQLGSEGLTSHEVFEALDLCLECKACKAECPTFVDMAKLKYEFLYQYQQRHGVPLRSRLFAHIETLMALGSAFAPFSTWAARSAPARLVMEKILGIDRRRRLPPFRRRTFVKWFKSRGGRVGHIPEGADPERSIVLFHDTFLNYNEPEIGIGAVRLFESGGWEVFLPDKKCCGRPMISKGLLDRARENAVYNVERLFPLVERGFRIVGCEPSCILTFRDDYLDLLRGDLRRKAEKVAQACFTFEEFLADAIEKGAIRLRLKSGPRRVLLHGHCHQKSLVGTEPARKILSLIPDCEVEEIDSGCCGMAGAFGYEKEHYEISCLIAERRLLPAVREAGPETAVVAAGTSCRQQIRDLSDKHPWHPAELLGSLLVKE